MLHQTIFDTLYFSTKLHHNWLKNFSFSQTKIVSISLFFSNVMFYILKYFYNSTSISLLLISAVRADRMRGGRNKFGPMYKRDRARKLQIARQRQLALQALRGSMSGPEGALSQLSPSSYQQSYSNMHIKQEIQIPQVKNKHFFKIKAGSFFFIAKKNFFLLKNCTHHFFL